MEMESQAEMKRWLNFLFILIIATLFTYRFTESIRGNHWTYISRFYDEMQFSINSEQDIELGKYIRLCMNNTSKPDGRSLSGSFLDPDLLDDFQLLAVTARQPHRKIRFLYDLHTPVPLLQHALKWLRRHPDYVHMLPNPDITVTLMSSPSERLPASLLHTGQSSGYVDLDLSHEGLMVHLPHRIEYFLPEDFDADIQPVHDRIAEALNARLGDYKMEDLSFRRFRLRSFNLDNAKWTAV